MKTSILKSQFYLIGSTSLTNPSANFSIKTKSHLKNPTTTPTKPNFPRKILVKTRDSRKGIIINQELPKVSANGISSRFVVMSAVSVGFVLFVMGMDEHSKALALGPEGPLMEEFWDNVRRYALYALTVSTGALYTIFQPIVELLKNPISAVLIVIIFGGSIFLISQVLSAMVGVTDFTYDYGY
ncbi:uncharacterized protein LOC110621288 [Manihot esculenta]|uniref:Uncharacterized protein ycf33 n=1 Tax=Manihot esculenta TaxID=3983 RepID=A0A2C9VGG3_MANES|nr:uncharacterized protein LOC110621288 [Manihot esculenta]OAY43441.1 hypothetical protein MANES_08G070500v8 [Manihot esculenta]